MKDVIITSIIDIKSEVLKMDDEFERTLREKFKKIRKFYKKIKPIKFGGYMIH